jgi:hypothetical protein
VQARGVTPRTGHSLGGRPVRESRTPVNGGKQPSCDNGEAVAGLTTQPPLYPLRLRENKVKTD